MKKQQPDHQQDLPDFHLYQETTITVHDEPYRIVTKPGIFSWDRLDDATALLIEQMQIAPGDTVLDLGCGYGLVGLVAANLAAQGRVYLVDNNVVAVEAARRTQAINGIGNVEVRIGDCASAVQDVLFDVVVSHLPRGKDVAQQFIADAAAVLKPGGRLYIAGHNKSGIKPFVRSAQTVFGNGEVVAYRRGCRVALCTKDEQTAIPETDYYRWHESSAQIGAPSKRYLFAAKPGVFSWKELDEGTRALIETMAVRSGDKVLDIGCGSGIIGAVAAQKGEYVYLVDSNLVAVSAARRTLALNGVHNAEVALSDGVQAVRDIRFDLVVTNPPFHQGRQTDYSVAHQFIQDAACVLNPKGRLYLVANRFIRYEHQMEQVFQDVRVAYEDNRFRVLFAQKPKLFKE
ncbi:MAG: class I SAM-dependent methyltransferase [Anaerolineae bacterium]|nr:class I SAM-dependent methyltransferase [Anaerolineae bacterium]